MILWGCPALGFSSSCGLCILVSSILLSECRQAVSWWLLELELRNNLSYDQKLF